MSAVTLAQASIIVDAALKKAREIPITPAMRAHVKKILAGLRASIENERLPKPTPYRKRCTDCEYRRFCGDVLTGG